MCPPQPILNATACDERELFLHIARHQRAAIDFALDVLEPFEVIEFLKDYRMGNLKPWPEFETFFKEFPHAKV